MDMIMDGTVIIRGMRIFMAMSEAMATVVRGMEWDFKKILDRVIATFYRLDVLNTMTFVTILVSMTTVVQIVVSSTVVITIMPRNVAMPTEFNSFRKLDLIFHVTTAMIVTAREENSHIRTTMLAIKIMERVSTRIGEIFHRQGRPREVSTKVDSMVHTRLKIKAREIMAGVKILMKSILALSAEKGHSNFNLMSLILVAFMKKKKMMMMMARTLARTGLVIIKSPIFNRNN